MRYSIQLEKRSRVGIVSSRRAAIAELTARYVAAHPGVAEAAVSVLDVALWLASRQEAGVS